MLNILVLGDIHNNISALLDIRTFVCSLGSKFVPDVVLVTGDFITYRKRLMTPMENQRVRFFMQKIEKELSEYHTRVLCVPGNHDRPDLWNIEGCIRSIDVLANRQQAELGGFRFVGFGGGWPLGGLPYEWVDDEALFTRLDATMPEMDKTPEILVSHVPPIGVGVGTTQSGEEVGSRVARELIIKRQPFINICGHVHEASGWGVLGKTYVLNAGAVAGPIPLARINPSLDMGTSHRQYVYSHANFHLLQLDPVDEPIVAIAAYLVCGQWIIRWIHAEKGCIMVCCDPHDTE